MRVHGLAIIALLVFFALGLSTAVVTTPTVDEPMHLFRGVAIWQTGSFQFQHNHPPLAHRLIGALPILLEPTVPDVVALPSWASQDRIQLSQEFLWGDQRPALARFVLLGRLGILFSGLLLGALLMRWAADLGNSVTLALVGGVFAFAPNVLAHFSLATTDGILTATYVATLFFVHRYWQRPSPARLGLAGGALGLALSAKLTAGILVVVVLLLAYLRQWQRKPASFWWLPLRFMLLLSGVAAFVVWASYGFSISQPTLLPLNFPLPAATYLDNVYELFTHIGGGHRAYLLGEISADGWWNYFLVAFFVKTPVAVLASLVLVGVTLVRQRGKWLWSTAVLWLPALALFTFASLTRLNIGYRHLLPMLPLLWLLTALAVTQLWELRPVRFMLPLLLLIDVGFALAIHPQHLAYFNWLAGGPTQGHRYLGDSNLDWGQNLDRLANHAAESQRPFHYAYFGSADPAAYGLTTPPLVDEPTQSIRFAPANPAPGVYALSASYVQGINRFEPDAFDWFRRRAPDDFLGYNIFLYEVEAAAGGEWLATCLNLALPFDQAERLLGIAPGAPVRHVTFDCANSWVFPDGGAPGWYVLPRRDDLLLPGLLPEILEPVYQHAATSLAPDYEVYYWPGADDLHAWLDTLPATAVTTENTAVSLPQTFGGAAQLQGYGRVASHWFTVWEALQPPPEPVSIAGHLYVDPAAPPTVADGLGYPLAQWQSGDIWVQQHHFADGSGYYLETGLYTLTDGRRLSRGDADSPFLRLPVPLP